jgi:hypothetical protein
MMVTPEILQELEENTKGIQHGFVRLVLHIRNGQLSRYCVDRRKSTKNEKFPTRNDCSRTVKVRLAKKPIPVIQKYIYW